MRTTRAMEDEDKDFKRKEDEKAEDFKRMEDEDSKRSLEDEKDEDSKGSKEDEGDYFNPFFLGVCEEHCFSPSTLLSQMICLPVQSIRAAAFVQAAAVGAGWRFRLADEVMWHQFCNPLWCGVRR